MGTWGAEVFENDHGADLFSTEVRRLAKEIEFVLSLDPVAFDDLEGPLIYVHILGLLANTSEVREIQRAGVEAWKERYLEIFTSTFPPGHEEYVKARQAVIRREFDTLIARLPELEESATKAVKPKAAKKATKATRKKK